MILAFVIAVAVSALFGVSNAWKLCIHDLRTIHSYRTTLQHMVKHRSASLSLPITDIRKTVAGVPPTRFISQPKLVHLNGELIWKYIDALNAEQTDDYFRHFVLPHLREKFSNLREMRPHITRVSHLVEPGIAQVPSEILSMEDFYRQELVNGPQIETVKRQRKKKQIIGDIMPFCTSSLRAIIVPYDHLEKLKTLFPNINVRRFENTDDFYYHAVPDFYPRVLHDKVIDMFHDDELWSTHHTTPVITDPFHVDVIIHANRTNSIEEIIMADLAEKRWRYNRPLKNPKLLLSPLKRFVSYRLPATGGGMPIAQLKQCADEVEKVIVKLRNTFDGCGWFTGTPQIKIVNFHTDSNKANVLCEPGTEHMYSLPATSKQVADWIFDGSVVSGKVLLVKARFDLDRSLNKTIDCANISHEELYNSNADKTVFYCNNASSRSPGKAEYYLRWLREHHPESEQQCCVLEDGVNGLYRYFKENHYSDEDILKVFKNRLWH